jgi:hypothetical protein
MVVIIIKYIKSEDFIMNHLLLLLIAAGLSVGLAASWNGTGTAAGYAMSI